jgi:hypothetical protein
MAGNPTSIETVVGAGAVAKADFRAHSDAGQVNVHADADALRATNATPQLVAYVASLDTIFRRDPASSAADDGVAVIVDGNGNRWLARDDGAVEPSAAFVASRTALKALDTASVVHAYLTEAGREGVFLWDASDLSATLVRASVASTAVNSGTETVTKADHGQRGRDRRGRLDDLDRVPGVRRDDAHRHGLFLRGQGIARRRPTPERISTS